MIPGIARAVLPINYSGDRREILPTGQEVVLPAGFKFSELTLSNLTRGSRLYWIHFLFVYCFTFWVMWLLVKYYQARRPLFAQVLAPVLVALPISLLLHVLGHVASRQSRQKYQARCPLLALCRAPLTVAPAGRPLLMF